MKRENSEHETYQQIGEYKCLSIPIDIFICYIDILISSSSRLQRQYNVHAVDMPNENTSNLASK